VAKIGRVLLATSNPGKLREYREMVAGAPVEFELMLGFASLGAFEESAPTFAENAAGKAIHYSRSADEPVLADDSGLTVAALGGEPGVRSARYAGENATDMDRVRKLLQAMEGKSGDERRAQFVCVIALAWKGRTLAVVSDTALGMLTDGPRGDCGFGYDPIFFDTEIGRTFGEISQYEKNHVSHRGKAFRRLLALLSGANPLNLPQG
jgi:XTP/dITP diphosphohydrolase